jgi:competence protein ComEC
LKPLIQIPKYGRVVMILLSIIFLWLFAALAGLSPSVLRASTMFSFLALSQISRRKTNSLNMLSLSALVLLLFRPQFLFEVGFQLSYAAVFAIVLLYPVFSKWYLPDYKLPRILVSTVYVSLAAQIGVLPFQLFYFHQFPGLFLIANIVIIPFLGLFLSGGIVCIVLSLLGWLPKFFVVAYAFLLDVLVSFVDFLSGFKAFLIQDIFFTKPMFITCLVMVVLFILTTRDFKSKQMMAFFLISVLIFSLTSIQNILSINQKSEFIIFHQPKSTIIGVKNKDKLTILSNSSEIDETDYWLKNYKLINKIKAIDFQERLNIYKYGHKRICIIDSSGVFSPDIKADIVLLSGSPDLHFEKFILEVKPKMVVADAQNYRSYVERWKATASDFGVAFHSTYDDGYFSLNLD